VVVVGILFINALIQQKWALCGPLLNSSLSGPGRHA